MSRFIRILCTKHYQNRLIFHQVIQEIKCKRGRFYLFVWHIDLLHWSVWGSQSFALLGSSTLGRPSWKYIAMATNWNGWMNFSVHRPCTERCVKAGGWTVESGEIRSAGELRPVYHLLLRYRRIYDDRRRQQSNAGGRRCLYFLSESVAYLLISQVRCGM